MKKVWDRIKVIKYDYTDKYKLSNGLPNEEHYKYVASLEVANHCRINIEHHDDFPGGEEKCDEHWEDSLKRTIINYLYGEIMDDVVDLERELIDDDKYSQEIYDKFQKLMNKLQGV